MPIGCMNTIQCANGQIDKWKNAEFNLQMQQNSD